MGKLITSVILVSMVLVISYGFITAPVFALDETKVDLRADLDTVGDAGFGEDSGTTDLPTRVGNLIRIVLGILGVILVVIVVYAGYLWMTAGGDDDQVKKAKSFMTNAVIGLIIMLSAYAITEFVVDKLLDATNDVS
jgi:hypothetical protein